MNGSIQGANYSTAHYQNSLKCADMFWLEIAYGLFSLVCHGRKRGESTIATRNLGKWRWTHLAESLRIPLQNSYNIPTKFQQNPTESIFISINSSGESMGNLLIQTLFYFYYIGWYQWNLIHFFYPCEFGSIVSGFIINPSWFNHSINSIESINQMKITRLGWIFFSELTQPNVKESPKNPARHLLISYGLTWISNSFRVPPDFPIIRKNVNVNCSNQFQPNLLDRINSASRSFKNKDQLC